MAKEILDYVIINDIVKHLVEKLLIPQILHLQSANTNNINFQIKMLPLKQAKLGHYLLFMFSPLRNKLDNLRNKKYLLICTYCFLPNSALQFSNYLFWFWKSTIVRYLIIFDILCFKTNWNLKECEWQLIFQFCWKLFELKRWLD